ncbi:hypothetical protein PM082_012567 [Marasmius tenuissimus]|nr:hypothetical protein PM082_012567 [Marasmius tenuissimus]
MLIWWIVFDLLIYLGPVFQKCKPSTNGWLTYKMFTTVNKLSLVIDLMFLIPLVWIIYLVRHFKDIRGEYRRHMSKKKDISIVQRLGRAIKSFVISQWDVITRSHPWIFPYTVLICYFVWANSLLIWLLDPRWYFYWVRVELTGDDSNPPEKDSFKLLGYGQLLAVGTAIEPLWLALKLAYCKRRNVVSWFKQCPRFVWDGVVFIITGHRNPWKQIEEETRRRMDTPGVGRDALYTQITPTEFVVTDNRRDVRVEDLQA